MIRHFVERVEDITTDVVLPGRTTYGFRADFRPASVREVLVESHGRVRYSVTFEGLELVSRHHGGWQAEMSREFSGLVSADDSAPHLDDIPEGLRQFVLGPDRLRAARAEEMQA